MTGEQFWKKIGLPHIGLPHRHQNRPPRMNEGSDSMNPDLLRKTHERYTEDFGLGEQV